MAKKVSLVFEDEYTHKTEKYHFFGEDAIDSCIEVLEKKYRGEDKKNVKNICVDSST